MLRRLVILATLFWMPAVAQKKPVNLDAVTATPPTAISEPVWSPDGSRLVFKKEGKLHLYDLASRSGKELVAVKALEDAAAAPPADEAFPWVNRGVGEKDVQWFPKGDRLLLLAKGDLFVYDLAAARWDSLLKTGEAEHDPKLSPDGARLSFRRGHNLFVLDLATRKVERLTSDGSYTRRNAELDWVYPEELGIPSAHWWSPDSKSIAYLQFDLSPIMQYPHGDLLKLRPVAEPQRFPQAGTPNPNVWLGVVNAKGGRTRWLDLGGPADALIGRVTWLPNSRAIAVHQLTRIQNELTLLAVDADSGKRRTILEETDRAWINLEDDWKALAGSRRLIWGSDSSGHRHLYLAALDGGTRTPITSGEWDVTELACVDEAHSRIFYVSTESSPLERQLYRIGFDGAGKQRLSSEPGTHSITMAPDCRRYLDVHSSLAEPPRRALHDANGKIEAVLADRSRATLDQYEILPNELIRFRGADGTGFHARLIRPAGFDPTRKYPAIVQIYGGPHAQTVRDSWRGADWDQMLAHRGFVIWQMDNRGSFGRGHGWESPLHRRFGRQELADQLEGVRHLISLGFVDPARIGMNGWSYGGYMTLYSLFNAPDVFRAGISGAPVTDWRQYDTIYTERYLGLPSENEEGYRESSAITHAAKLKGRLLLVHNFEDDNVLFQHSLRLMDALQKAGKQYEFLLYPQKSHAVSGPARKHLLEAMTAFFERHLAPSVQ